MASFNVNHYPYFPLPPPFQPFHPPPHQPYQPSPPAVKPPSHTTPPPFQPYRPPPHQPFQPPPPAVKPPIPTIPPPPHSRPLSPPPPPPHKPITPPPPPPRAIPPPPHKPITPPSPLLPPPPPSNNHPAVIIIVFVSLGGLFLLAFLGAALFCFVKKRKEKNVEETDMIHIDEHRKIKEAIIQGPHGNETVVLSVEDEIHFDEKIIRSEKDVEKGLMHGTKSNEEIIASSSDHKPSQLTHN